MTSAYGGYPINRTADIIVPIKPVTNHGFHTSTCGPLALSTASVIEHVASSPYVPNSLEVLARSVVWILARQQ